MTQLTAANLATVRHRRIGSALARLPGQDHHIDTLTPQSPRWARVTEKEQEWHKTESCREEQNCHLKAQRTELEESTLLMNFSFLLVIYIFVTIQLLNVCLVLFLTLLYIRTQR